MVFSSPIFLFLFLPSLLLVHAMTPVRLRNTVLLLFSLIFYAWGEIAFLLTMLVSIAMNYLFGLLAERYAVRGRESRTIGRLVMPLAVGTNLALLGYFKYANFLADNINALRQWLDLGVLRHEAVALPLGISFFTFHSLSYVIDVHRRITPACRNPINMALYISLFPQLVAGPIIRYHDVASQIVSRRIGLEKFSSGVARFCIGLGKKMLVANPVGALADRVFALPLAELAPGTAWLGIVGYTLQIYFDFSGYSDMAIGLGRMFGFEFLENFSYPYTARSVQDFWRRWHISLSNWFRDYLYIPLGGNRRAPGRVYFNLVTVFFLCGLWHGASWTFVVWGLYHGLFLAAERLGAGRAVARLWRPFQHAYAMLVVLVGWVFFRSETLAGALDYLGAMAGSIGAGAAAEPLMTFLKPEVAVALAAGVIGSLPVFPLLQRLFAGPSTATDSRPARLGNSLVSSTAALYLLAVALLAIAAISTGTYNPFIYYRF